MMDRKDSNHNASHEAGSLVPALKAGTLGGAYGLIFGGVTGILRGHEAGVHSVAGGLHWFALGTSYWWLRSSILRYQFNDNANPNQRAYVSAVAGGLAGGGVSWALRRRFVPGLLAFAALGGLGQLAYTAVDEWHTQQLDKPSKSLSDWVAESRWLPIRTLSDEQYRDMLNEKLLNVEVDIALIDEKIQALRDSQRDNDKDE